MANEIVSLQPSVGVIVNAFFGGNSYKAIVISHGKRYPKIRFRLKNGRTIEGRATIIPHDSPLGVPYRGYLARMFHPSAYER